MSPLQPIDLSTPYHDPESPLYPYSTRTHLPIMTHASQLSPTSRDYFTHKPRSFIASDEKLPLPYTPGPRKPSRLLGYEQPIPNPSSEPSRPRAPLRRTLIRLLVLTTVLTLCALGWRCESVGCKGRGGGTLVGDFDYEVWENEFVGGGSVIAGWGTPGGVDLSGIWDRPSWGGREQIGQTGEGLVDEEGELVGGYDDVESGHEAGEVKEGRQAQWDDEAGGFGDVVHAQGIVGEVVEVVPEEQQIELPIPTQAQQQDESEQDNQPPVEPLVANKMKRDNPHAAHEAALIDVVAGNHPPVPTDTIHIEGEHVLATNTSSVSPQAARIGMGDDGEKEDESWTGFLRWWW